MTERADRITEPLVKGRFYLVPTVFAAWGLDKPTHWPIIGAMHTDPEFFNFPEPHYHIDGRFVSKRWHVRVFHTPLSRPYALHRPVGPDSPPLPRPVMRRVKCLHPQIPYRCYSDDPTKIPPALIDLRAAYATTQCARGKGGWICPHRKASLGSIVPVDGIITCPLHGLQINAASGKVLEASTP